ncbi:metallophosphoesterase family protein [Desulfovibrio litoralis]|uniref:DNA repair exonuclease SbcCD nuclease subunit n=1 Tax=Desulfovibrio litoralis DSM 11393 TaxID=1121455 RepID=A0A1M7TA48_9BACT|nr:DNA repair exonuclease [Desulfovibrio litoralis]SHN67615.1 DNA repair exonuclease SbcCD nuclease subunit [Desulfovibrio litoralis DSM 11393]
MKTFTFIHAADLHLDSILPLAKFSLNDPDSDLEIDNKFNKLCKKYKKLSEDAVFIAFKNLIELCLVEKVDFLVLSGDLYHQADGSLKAYYALKNAFVALNNAGIAVFIAHGNHDHLKINSSDLQENSEIKNILQWESNVKVFGNKLQRLEFCKDNECLALLHGISHAKNAETQNLGKDFNRQEPTLLKPDCFQIGVLHCTIGKSDEHERYAPCNLSDLIGSRLDYWALGHIHKRQVLCEQPAIHYPGSLQGLHINETGQHGCLLVKVNELGQSLVTFKALAPVQWELINIDFNKLQRNEQPDEIKTQENTPENDYDLESAQNLTIQSLDELEEYLLETCINVATQTQSPLCQLIIFRIVLEGCCELDSVLKKSDAETELVNKLNQSLQKIIATKRNALSSQSEKVIDLIIKDIHIKTKPVRDLNSLRSNSGFVGELLRYSDELLNQLEPSQAENNMEDKLALHQTYIEQETELKHIVDELYLSKRNNKFLPPKPSHSSLQALIKEAEELCLEKLKIE